MNELSAVLLVLINLCKVLLHSHVHPILDIVQSILQLLLTKGQLYPLYFFLEAVADLVEGLLVGALFDGLPHGLYLRHSVLVHDRHALFQQI